eukprot:6708076-Alexandrium_andersonii.AAC.1
MVPRLGVAVPETSRKKERICQTDRFHPAAADQARVLVCVHEFPIPRGSLGLDPQDCGSEEVPMVAHPAQPRRGRCARLRFGDAHHFKGVHDQSRRGANWAKGLFPQSLHSPRPQRIAVVGCLKVGDHGR